MTTLYHYTSPAGLLGIIETRSFWASDYRFLNDTTEFTFGMKIIDAEIRRHQDDLTLVSPDAWFQVLSLADTIGKDDVVALVASFTTEGDLLSQWRGYNNGKGFSIGINSDWLLQNADRQAFQLIPIIYDLAIQEKSASSAVRLLIDLLRNADPARHFYIVGDWWQHALKVALACKDHHFEEEKEQRLVYIGRSWPSGTKMRPGPSGLIPYKPVKYDGFIIKSPVFHPNNFGLEDLIVGPSLKPQQARAVDALLAANHMRFQVRRSGIPYVAD